MTSINFDSITPPMRNATVRIEPHRGLFPKTAVNDDHLNARYMLNTYAYPEFYARRWISNTRNNFTQISSTMVRNRTTIVTILETVTKILLIETVEIVTKMVNLFEIMTISIEIRIFMTQWVVVTFTTLLLTRLTMVVTISVKVIVNLAAVADMVIIISGITILLTIRLVVTMLVSIITITFSVFNSHEQTRPKIRGKPNSLVITRSAMNSQNHPARDMPKVPCSNEMECYRRGGNHFANQCPQKPPTGPAARRQGRAFTLFVYSINSKEIYSQASLPQNMSCPELWAEINDIIVNCFIDSAASLSVISHTLAEFMGVSAKLDFNPNA